MTQTPETLPVQPRPDEAEAIRAELPEINLLSDVADQEKVIGVWASFLRESAYDRIGDAELTIRGCDLAGHIRQVARHCLFLGDSLTETWGHEYDREALLAAALTHDASKLVEFEPPNHTKSELGHAVLHAQLAGVRCHQYGLSHKVVYIVSHHPYTPPHTHIKPRYLEFVIMVWADLAAADPLLFLEGKPTHLDIEKRYFSMD